MNRESPRQTIVNLSPEGRERRAQMLPELQQQMATLHRRRRNRKRLAGAAVLGTAVLLAVAAIVWPRPEQGPFTGESATWLSDQPATIPRSPIDPVPTGTTMQSPPVRQPSVVHDRPGVLDRFLVSDTSVRGRLKIETMSDEELLDWLGEAGKPSFLGRIDGQMVLIPRKSL